MMNKFAVILAGSGVYDGAEIHEAVLTLLSIDQQGGAYQVFAPNIDQHHVINHLTGEEMPETRNVLVESARIARGNIKDLKDFVAGDFDALLLPGGFGVAKNLCNFAIKGVECDVDPEVEKVIKAMHKAGKPIGAMCISPVIVSKILDNVEVTIGQDQQTIDGVRQMGGTHIDTTHGEVVEDTKNNIFTTPCYMLDASIGQVYSGTTKLVSLMTSFITSQK
ncbi:MAG: isoprenoid biosynthesis protein ElbB [Bacteroidetes bacterium 4572_114]|nr:MAG: isoprenoid biosynthesis protein ElbB [Bacteroidetes bacterium 4572_114]